MRFHVCPHCGTTFSSERLQKYCSRRCCYRAWYERRKSSGNPVYQPIRHEAVLCRGCGTKFVPANINHKFCSRSCYDRTRRELKKLDGDNNE